MSVTLRTESTDKTQEEPSKLEKAFILFHEFFYKDISTYPTIARNMFRNAQDLGLNQCDFTCAKVTLLMHRQPSCFFPLAEKLVQAKISNVFTMVGLENDDEPIPTKELVARISEIAFPFFTQGVENVEFRFVGHSLGALVAAKWIWRGDGIKNVTVSKLISLAGRLKYVDCKYPWFCQDVRPEIEETYKAYQQNPKKVDLFTIWGDRDECVPEESAHLNPERALTVFGYGHGGVVFSEEAQDKIVEELS